MRRASFAAVLMVAAITPSPASPAAGSRPGSCTGPRCESAGTVRWARPLPGAWVARAGLAGTVPGRGEAYAAMNRRVAVIGFGDAVHAFAARTGRTMWSARLTGFPAGSVIVSVRVWPGVVTVGVDMPGTAPGGGPARREVVLAAATGRRLHEYPAAAFGGAVAARRGGLVIVGPRAVTGYGSAGAVRWRRPTGQAPQAWQVDSGSLYVTVAAGGYLGTAPVTAVRRISLRSGAERLIRPRHRSFPGTLSMAFDRIMLFTNASGVTAYSGVTGRRLWHRPRALPEGADTAARRLFLRSGNALLDVAPGTGGTIARVPGVAAGGSSGLYEVRQGAVLGLSHGEQGQAWGYDVASRRVVWTSGPLPWPHYFVDLSGIGGSASAGPDALLLAFCPRLGPAGPAAGSGQECARPELVAVNR